VNAVAIALGRAYNGNTTALARLGVNVKGVNDPLGVLAKQFDGAAEAAATLDPYQRLEIIFGNLQEQIGTALLPYLNDLADFFNSPEGQDALKQFASDVADIATSVIDLADALKLSGVLQDLATFVERAAALSKLDFAKLGQQDANAGMQKYLDLFKSNRKAYDEQIAFLKRAGGERAAAEVGLGGAVTPREADDLVRDAHEFIDLVSEKLGVSRQLTLQTADKSKYATISWINLKELKI
jgi:hypothetical protein